MSVSWTIYDAPSDRDYYQTDERPEEDPENEPVEAVAQPETVVEPRVEHIMRYHAALDDECPF